jgi:uncharacterized membrane protein YhaH (DUF805 family)
MALIFCTECGSQVSDKAVNCIKCGNPIRKIPHPIDKSLEVRNDKNIMYWYLKVLKQYGDFKGRARRKEYWMFGLMNMIFVVLAIILDNILRITISGEVYGPFYTLYVLATLVPGFAVGARRLHDVGKSAWMFLILLIPVVGAIWLLVLTCSNSQDGTNKWGKNPKENEDFN